MRVPIRDGIPLRNEYDTLLRSEAFREMETFSEAFLERNRGALKGYISKWGAENPLRSWSRQWEYPYVLQQVAEVVRTRPRARILDAGSGATFLPYYIRHRFEGTSVSCCDNDAGLEAVFSSLNENMGGDVEFLTADIRTLPYGDRSFDLVYCVSVLEHTDSYENILVEFSRVLKASNPEGAGRIAVTFDISLDGTRDMRTTDAMKLLKAFAATFGGGPGFAHAVKSRLADPAILTTHAAGDAHPDLLPWRGPALLHRIKSSFANRRLVGWPPLLTVCCVSA